MMKRILSYCRIIFLLSTPLFILDSPLMAQQSKIENVQVGYSKKNVPELFQQITVGFRFLFKDGSERKTKGLLRGKIPWRKVDITTEQGTFKKGKLAFDPALVWKNNHQVTFRVKFRDTTLQCHLKIPYLKRIRFNLYTDSIKRNVPYYLNVEGVFSSGKVYPLDTARVKFYVSAGNLERNILKIADEDTARRVRVKASFKWDAALCDTVTIPVKTHIANPTLPSEDDLLRSWKRK